MAWYRTGTVALANGSAAVAGTGTAFSANVKPGDGLRLPSGELLEIKLVVSDTSLTLAKPFTGATATGLSYEIVPTQGHIRDLAVRAAELVQSFSDIENDMIHIDMDHVDGLDTALGGKSDVGHGHAIANTTGLQTALDGKSAVGHGHVVADVAGLQTALDGKQAAGSYVTTVNFTFGNLGSKPTTLAGYGITDAQPLHAILTAVAALSGTSGFLKKTGANTLTLDTATYLTANQTITYTGDATGSGTTAVALTLANSGATAGTYKSVTVDAKGRVTGGTNPTTLAGYGITDAQGLNGSLTSIGGLAGTVGFLKKTAANTYTLDTSTYLTANQTITYTGDAAGSGTTAVTLTLPNIATAGTYGSVTVNAKGQVTAGTNPTTLAGHGITNGALNGAIGSSGITQNTAKLLGRFAAGVGAVQEITVSTGLNLDASGNLTASASAPTITLTGDVTGSGSSSFAATIADGAVTLAKQASMATGSVVYRKTASTGAPEVQTLATLKADLGLTGTNSGDQTITLTGAVTGSGAGSFATTLAANAVATANVADGAVTLAKQANMATGSVVYRKTASAGPPEVQTLATLKADLGLTGTNSGDQAIKTVGGQSLLGSGDVTLVSIGAANRGALTGSGLTVTSGTVAGRATAGSGALEELTIAPAFKIVSSVLKPNIESATDATGGTIGNTSGAYSDLSNPLSVTLTTGTEVLITMSCSCIKNSAAGSGFTGYVSYAVSGATTVNASQTIGFEAAFAAAGLNLYISRTYKITGLTAGSNTFTMMHAANANSTSYTNRSITVQAL